MPDDLDRMSSEMLRNLACYLLLPVPLAMRREKAYV